MAPQKLTHAEVDAALATLDGWTRTGDTIAKTFEFPSFQWAMQFVQSVGALAEELDHHPDIDVRYRKVTLAVWTHDAGGLSALDLTLARKTNALLEGI